ncbi:uncharacterized protein FOMMEDRAFT_118799 [Fomitiporia mediterranea MF3/22]|uniref:uncharacterized protein n=1 Tax=Fomitiporia mediterranea (strain MF3/22) TaxID=694068 RepID=UPI000440923C|nr:uncharacterized protein FOMMEDRAFT_118799 [Fomitiporia mediterranea MF3/22]EJD05625.1 hypothetical protein FOMMEDRAFT_118799 [Fomitiporia mediterranea MF3/22]
MTQRSSGSLSTTPGASAHHDAPVKLEWDQDAELVDRTREKRHDGNDVSFQVDRRVLRDIVKEKLGLDVARIRFISSGTFHKAYLVALSSGETVIARVARRYMPRLKTESEVATMQYLRAYTKIPVPEVYAWDSNPYNRLGGEYILMSRARGIPLRKVYHSLPLAQLNVLLRQLAELLVPLFGHRFSHIGSLYSEEGKFNSAVKTPEGSTDDKLAKEEEDHGHVPTPKLSQSNRTSSIDFAFGSSLPTPTRTPSFSTNVLPTPRQERTQFSLTPSSLSRPTSVVGRRRNAIGVPCLPRTFHIGPIVSWPFFGSGRGDLSHTSFPPEIERGPWASNAAYLRACANREALGVARENEGRAKPHKLHLDPDDVLPRGAKRRSKKGEYVWGYGFVRRARLAGFGEGDDESEDRSGEDDESEVPSDDREDSDSSSSVGSPALSVNSDVDEDMMYQDYRRFQRSTFLVAELQRREKRVRGEMERWRRCMIVLEGVLKEVVDKVQVNGVKNKEGVGGCSLPEGEMFSLDCHDLSLDNVFVDEKDHSKITCIIDWESTTTRPLWACAHLPSFLLSSPFSSNLFRKAIAALPADKFPHAYEWLVYERAGAPLRYAHKCVEWDGWEEGLVDSILGTVEHDTDDSPVPANFPGALALMAVEPKEFWEQDDWEEPLVTQMRLSFSCLTDGTVADATKLPHPLAGTQRRIGTISPSLTSGLRRASQSSAGSELEMERMLDVKGDICGGRGGELGRRLEAWLIESSPQSETKEL